MIDEVLKKACFNREARDRMAESLNFIESFLSSKNKDIKAFIPKFFDRFQHADLLFGLSENWELEFYSYFEDTFMKWCIEKCDYLRDQIDKLDREFNEL